MRMVLVAAVTAALILPVYAQSPAGSGIGAAQGAGRASQPKQQTPEEIAKKKAEEKANEKAFNEAVKRIPVSNKKYDPWGNIRSGNDGR